MDTGSSDGSSRLVQKHGIPVLRRRWEGYGAARSAAAQALQGCDYVFFLDSDEWLEQGAIATLQAWKRSEPRAVHHSLMRRDWARLDGRSFLYRTERHVRLVRRDAARWERRMIVHEALPGRKATRLPAVVEHQFAESVASMRVKVERYALLWAIRFREAARPVKPPVLQNLVHLLRETLLKGAVFRGGLRAFGLAEAVAHHHSRKYALLREVRRGAYAEMVEAFEQDRLEDLFRLLEQRVPAREEATVAPPLFGPATWFPAQGRTEAGERTDRQVATGA